MPQDLMRAFVARNGNVQLTTHPIPHVGPRDVLVRTTAASMCSADPAGVRGSFDATSADSSDRGGALVVGHEAVGVIEMLGDDVMGYHVGDRVITASATPCGQCENCQRGFGGHCGGAMWGAYSSGVTQDGVLSEFFLVPNAANNLAKVPGSVTDEGALFVTDSFATGSTAIESTGLPLGGTVAVFGQGHIGLGAIAAARIAGASLVIAIKNSPTGEDRAYRLGADVALNYSQHDVGGEISRLTGGVGVDLAVEASGVQEAFGSAVQATRLGGEVSVIATYTEGPKDELAIPLAHWGWGVGDKQIRTRFQRASGERTARLLRLVEHGRVDPSVMFTHEYTFTDIEQAFADMAAGVAGLVKPIIRFT